MMLRDILVWWAQQLRDLLPASRGSVRSALLLVAPNLPADILAVRRGQQELGRFRLDPQGLAGLRALLARGRAPHCNLVLPESSLLERAVTLPLAAERDWQRVMQYEMDRLTPFAANEVFWSGAVTGRDRAQSRLELLLWLVPRAPLERLLAAIAQVGLRPEALQAHDADGQTRLIALQHDRSHLVVWERRALAAAGGLCAALAVAALALPFVMQSLALQHVEQRIAALQPAAREAEALRRADLTRESGSAAIAARLLHSADPLAVLAAVTDALPDDTYLSQFSLEQNRLSLTGQSAAAARLIAALATSPRLRNPVFSAPVTRNEALKTDVFSIRAEVGP